MAPTIYVVRHAQGYHNVNNQHHLRDPDITPLGYTQCAQLASKFPQDVKISAIMASPLTRTIQTACLGFTKQIQESDVPFVLLPMAQEIANQPCDIGLAPDALKQRAGEWLKEQGLGFGIERMDWSEVHEGWNSKEGPYKATLKAVVARAAALRAWLYARPEQTIVLVSHGAFLHDFSEDWTFFDGARGTAYENCEFRKFTFAEGSNAEEAHLEEHGGAKVKVGRPPGVYAHVLEGMDEVEKEEEVNGAK